MTGQLYEVVVTASGEVRDKDGNLISSEPVEARMVVTEDEARALMGNTQGEQA